MRVLASRQEEVVCQMCCVEVSYGVRRATTNQDFKVEWVDEGRKEGRKEGQELKLSGGPRI